MDRPSETWTVAVEANVKPLTDELVKAQQAGQLFARSLSSVFEGVALRGKSLSDSIRGVALSLSKVALTAAFKPLEAGLAQLVTGLAGGTVAMAKGGVVPSGLPVPFAKGGVIASPVAFPLGQGRTGLAGEAGPEAIMPLARGADGRLGVRAAGAGGGVAVTFNISTPDVDGFRRSQTQIAALLARTVGQGQRNL
jgi:phage-related minor tail protein